MDFSHSYKKNYRVGFPKEDTDFSYAAAPESRVLSMSHSSLTLIHRL